LNQHLLELLNQQVFDHPFYKRFVFDFDREFQTPSNLFINEDLSIEAEKMTREANIDVYIHKSADLEDLKQTIKNVLSKKK